MQSSITHTIWLAVLVLTSIHLDNQPHFQAHEVEDIIQERMQAAEFAARKLPTA